MIASVIESRKNAKKGKMHMTALYSILHLLVDGLCAIAMFGRFISCEDGYFYILLYNFCAFALQMPFGVMLDAMNGRSGGRKLDFAFLTAAAGVLCTIAGAVTHPVLLGIGNALFHVGGGVGTIREDHARHWRGRGLGVFVAPGALGLYLGNLIAAGNRPGAQFPGAVEALLAADSEKGELLLLPGRFLQGWNLWYFCVSVIMLLLLGVGIRCLRGGFSRESGARQPESGSGVDYMLQPESVSGADYMPQLGSIPREDYIPLSHGGAVRLTVCCLLVVVLRSYLGMAVTFSWKTGTPAGVLSVLAVVGGKALGGFLGAWKGARRTAAVSLALAAFCYLFSSVMPIGLAALLLFNMTMPITLYWMVCAFPKTPGFAFGFLTFALFLGFLPVYFGRQPALEGNIIGCVGSALSLLLLAAGLGTWTWNKNRQRERRSEWEVT